jgi:hypothetical protein
VQAKGLRSVAFLGLFLAVSCGNGKGSGLKDVPRCLSATEAMTLCHATYIADGFTLDQARLRCDPFFTMPGCYSSQLPASP